MMLSLPPMATLPQSDIERTIDSLRKVVDMCSGVSFELFRTNTLCVRSAKGFLNGCDPKTMQVLCKITMTKVGYQILWLSDSTKPAHWDKHKIYEHDVFDHGLRALITSENSLTIGSLQVFS